MFLRLFSKNGTCPYFTILKLRIKDIPSRECSGWGNKKYDLTSKEWIDIEIAIIYIFDYLFSRVRTYPTGNHLVFIFN